MKVEGRSSESNSCTYSCGSCGHSASALAIDMCRYLASQVAERDTDRKVVASPVEPGDVLQCPVCGGGMLSDEVAGTLCIQAGNRYRELSEKQREKFFRAVRKDPLLKCADPERLWEVVRETFGDEARGPARMPYART
jgi:hypothetical protein